MLLFQAVRFLRQLQFSKQSTFLMADVFTPEKRSEVMSRIRGRGNRDTELKLAKLFRQHHITGWRRHLKLRLEAEICTTTLKNSETNTQPSKLRGYPRQRYVRPDFVFPRSRVVIFVDGCFWHSCPEHLTIPKSNQDFWQKKLTSTKLRDRMVNQSLVKSGWQVIRIWEHDLADQCVQRVLDALSLKAQGK